MRLGRIGFDQVEGYLLDGMDALRERADLIRQSQRITAAALDEQREAVTVVDVRAAKEWQDGHIEGSINIPLNHLDERHEELPTDKPLVVHCQGGYRSSIAVSLLQRAGFSNVFDLVGGYKAWVATRLPVEAK
jgi:rhodanese-related sulfurtransferase